MQNKISQWRAIIESMFVIPDKQGVPVPFELNWAQADLDANISGRDLVPKARQLGISTYCLGRATAQCMTNQNWRAVIISHEEEATKRLLSRARFIIENLKMPKKLGIEYESMDLVLPTERLSAAEIRFSDTGSWFYIGTAGAKAFGRGDTINFLHGSEVAYWPNAKELLDGLMGSISEQSEVILESTGNGVANNYAKRTMASINGKSHWKTHFYPWHKEPTYKVEIPEGEKSGFMSSLDDELEENRLVEDFALEPEQLLWRRRKIYDMSSEGVGYIDLSSFKQEFPMTIDECFQQTGNTIFDRVTYRPTAEWNRKFGPQGGRGWLTGHPRPDYHYVMGVDPSGGVGKDNATIEIGCIETNEQVLTWFSNKTPPDLLVNRVIEMGKEYNNCYIVVESNNHGLVVVNGLRSFLNGEYVYPQHLLHRHRPADSTKRESGLMDLGYQTQARTKPMAIGRARTFLANGYILHDEQTYMETQAFGETDAGKLEGLDGSPDDRVMALVMMFSGWQKAMLVGIDQPPQHSRKVGEFTVEGIMASIKSAEKQTDNYPIKFYLEGDEDESSISDLCG